MFIFGLNLSDFFIRYINERKSKEWKENSKIYSVQYLNKQTHHFLNKDFYEVIILLNF